ncbi:putative structural maintenance of chromosome complex subunit protein [Rosellinia necatrix]|uniref:Structural maintenance of chromosomes protein 5 n=1 Tax=Rosellinia necatrix TaxID=77044 RepID=A0A1W2TGL2_ROSNE|nr:putative structural maintenance of chromosome complex subunit protein [Rosellinia necatrix]
MPSLEPRRRSRAVYEEDDDPEPSPSTSDSSKRRKSGMRSHVPEEEGGEEEEEEEVKAEAAEEMTDGSPAPPTRKANGRASAGHRAPASGPGEFHPGAIVRVRVDNFVTYKRAEFLPGPNLNMVIGPNGTGKSSLVCAICLGLGYHPKHLGRASHVGEFVKHGEESATIEVELQKRPKDRANHVIRVRIDREDNGRKWWLNGKESTHKAVQELTRTLRIQIDNLCQFLPQDKVAEFAGLTPTRLLEETLRAAAPEEVLDWQVELKKLYKDHREMKAQVENCLEILKNHESRQQGLQADVDRLHEREAIQKQVQDLKSARAVAEYNDKRLKFSDAKRRLKDAKNKLEDLQNACGPALEAVNRKQEYQAQIEPVVIERKKALRDAEVAAERALRAIEAFEESIKSEENKMKAEEDSLRNIKSKIQQRRKELTNLEGRLKDKPPEFVPGEWNAKIRQKESAKQDIEAERRMLDDRFDELKGTNSTLRATWADLKRQFDNLNSQQGKKLAQLKSVHADAAKGWEWLLEHQDQFQKEVFGPPMLTCSITDKSYSDQIQSLLNQDDFICFICQTPSDHKKLSNQFYGEMGIAVPIRTCGSTFSSFRPAIPRDRLPDFGLDAYAIEYLEGPEPVLAMLCAERKLHTSGVARSDTSNAHYEQLMAVERIPQWAAGTRVYRVARRREYGPSATSTSARTIRPGRFWSDQPVDESERVEVETRIQEVMQDIDSVKREGIELREKKGGLDEREEEVQAEIDALRRQKNELQKAATQYATLGDKIPIVRGQLEDAQKSILDARIRIYESGARSDELVLERAQSVLQHKELLSNIRDAHQALLEVQIRLIEAKSDVKALEERNLDIKKRLDEEQAEIRAAKDEADRLKEDAQVAKETVSEAVADDPDRLPYLNGLAAGKTVEDLDNEIGAEQSKLEYVHAVDPAVVRQFRKRAQEIQNLTLQKEELTAKFDSLSRKTDELRRKWEPRVDALVTKINDAFAYNFEQINCAGQVDVYKDEEDFEQWAIEIKVKFRQNETLQQLNQHRQSGGERAVSTIFYLMALQSMAQAPFRVVDEINQGMDPRNERMVHERMVEIACREHTSQYFLITPKLLTGLRYDPRMRILCIASGEHMPPEGRRLDFRNLVKIQRAITAAG